MPVMNTTLLPPILEYSYPAFRYDIKGNGNTVTFKAGLSITNSIDQVDHIQLRIVSLNSNKNGLNPKIFPTGYYFIKLSPEQEKLDFTINTKIDEQNIFSINEEPPFPSYYKMQIRLGIKGEHEYDPSWGQNVSEDWLRNYTESFSEWSNAATLKTTDAPSFGIFNLRENGVNILEDNEYLWSGFYSTQDNNESLKYYEMELYDSDHILLESSGKRYIGEYETPSINFSFEESLVNHKNYFLRLKIKTLSDYEDYIEYLLETSFSYVKIYNVLSVEEDDDDANNKLIIQAKQILLDTSFPIEQESWLQDKNMEKYGETGVTHLKINKGALVAKKGDFLIPYNNFSILLSITNFQDKIKNRVSDCFFDNNWIFELHDNLKNYQYKIGVSRDYDNKILVVLQTNFENYIQYYYVNLNSEIIYKNQEFLLAINNNNGTTEFKAIDWHENNFI